MIRRLLRSLFLRVGILMVKVRNNMAKGLTKMETFYYTDKDFL